MLEVSCTSQTRAISLTFCAAPHSCILLRFSLLQIQVKAEAIHEPKMFSSGEALLQQTYVKDIISAAAAVWPISLCVSPEENESGGHVMVRTCQS